MGESIETPGMTFLRRLDIAKAVSYTHLTLPTT